MKQELNGAVLSQARVFLRIAPGRGGPSKAGRLSEA